MREKPIQAKEVQARKGQTIYPAPFAEQVAGRLKRKLGDVFGLANFGINLTQLDPGAVSALFHSHEAQDEFIYVIDGTPTLVFGDNEYALAPGDCIGFKAGTGIAHQLVNRSTVPVTFIEVGDRTTTDTVEYPDDDIQAVSTPDGSWAITRKDGTPY